MKKKIMWSIAILALVTVAHFLALFITSFYIIHYVR